MKTYQLDIWGEMCPLPLLKAQQKIKEMEVGDKLVMETEHSCTSRAVVQWGREKGYEVWEKEVAVGIWRLELIKK